MRSLRARLGLVLLLSLVASVTVAMLMSQLYDRSSSLVVARAKDRAASACDDVRGAWRYYGSGWSGPAPSGAEIRFRADLRALLLTALGGGTTVGGIWRPNQGLLASVPAEASALPPPRLWRTAAADSIDEGSDLVRDSPDHGDTVVIATCRLGGPVPDLVAWTSRRIYAGTGLAQLRLGFGVLLALVVGMTGCLSWLVVSWSRHVRSIERALTGHATAVDGGSLPMVQATGELELDRIVGALNAASTRLAAAQREAAGLAERVAASERMAALGRVAAGVAHEIRNPIAAMRLRAENALAGDDARRSGALGTILEQIGRLDGLLAELLAMTQGRAPNLVELGLAAFLQAMSREHDETARVARVSLRVEVAHDATVRFDPGMIGRAITNLLQNALRAAPAGGGVTLAGACLSDRTLVISVADDGPGIPQSVRARLFEPFVTSRADGTGLGLAIAREMVASHGGTLDLGDCRAGAHFVIRLPGACPSQDDATCR